VGRSLLNAPHATLLDQAVETLGLLRAAPDLRAGMAAVGLDGEGLLREFEAAVPDARARQTEVALAKAAKAEQADLRGRWLQEVEAWAGRVRARLDSSAAPHQRAAARAVRAALPRDGVRRFTGTAAATRDALAVLDTHAVALGVADWPPELTAAGPALAAAAGVLSADADRVDARVAQASAALVASRGRLQHLLRRLRAAEALARLERPSLPETPWTALVGYARRARSESDTVAGRTDTVAGRTDTVAGRTDTVAGRTDTVASELWTVVGESDGVVDRAVGVAHLQRVTTVVDSLTTVHNLPATVSVLPTTVSVLPTTVSVLPTTVSVLPTTVDDSLATVDDAPRGRP
jgi:hypothetical protein